MPHNYIVIGTNPKDPATVKQDVTEAARANGGNDQNTFYVDLANNRVYAFCGFDQEAKAKTAVSAMVKALTKKAYNVRESGVVATATELGLRLKRGASRRKRPARPRRGGATRRRRR